MRNSSGLYSSFCRRQVSQRSTKKAWWNSEGLPLFRFGCTCRDQCTAFHGFWSLSQKDLHTCHHQTSQEESLKGFQMSAPLTIKWKSLTCQCNLPKPASVAFIQHLCTRISWLQPCSFSKYYLQLWRHSSGYQGLDQGQGLRSRIVNQNFWWI